MKKKKKNYSLANNYTLGVWPWLQWAHDAVAWCTLRARVLLRALGLWSTLISAGPERGRDEDSLALGRSSPVRQSRPVHLLKSRFRRLSLSIPEAITKYIFFSHHTIKPSGVNWKKFICPKKKRKTTQSNNSIWPIWITSHNNFLPGTVQQFYW